MRTIDQRCHADLLVFVLQATLHANTQEAGKLPMPWVWTVLGGYVLFTLVWTVRFLGRFFKKPPDAIAADPD